MENNNIVDNRGEKPDKISGLIKNKKFHYFCSSCSICYCCCIF